MKVIYVILATTGWIWLAVVVVLLWLRLRSLPRRPAVPGSDVVTKHDE
ncbi:MAG: hypothetical protein ACM359_22960 [Bacillota bacterium]